MAAAKKKKAGKTARPDFRWIALIFLTTVLISALMSFVSSNLLEGAGLALSFLILICIVLTGILFDIIGVAVTAADEVPFHAMASRKVPEAEDALRLIRNAGKVSSFCNDVIGDICGVISGSAAAVIAARVLILSKSKSEIFITLLLSAVVSGVTVGGSEAIDIAMRAVLEPGDEVIIPTPCFVCYAPIAELCGAVPVTVRTRSEDRFKLTPELLESAITPRTKMLVLAYPNNPTGVIKLMTLGLSEKEAEEQIVNGFLK